MTGSKVRRFSHVDNDNDIARRECEDVTVWSCHIVHTGMSYRGEAPFSFPSSSSSLVQIVNVGVAGTIRCNGNRLQVFTGTVHLEPPALAAQQFPFTRNVWERQSTNVVPRHTLSKRKGVTNFLNRGAAVRVMERRVEPSRGRIIMPTRANRLIEAPGFPTVFSRTGAV